MKSLPNNNEPLELSINKQYYVIDALYLTEIKSEFLKANILPKDIRNEVFPYTDTPFALVVLQIRELYQLLKLLISRLSVKEKLMKLMNYVLT